MPQRFDVIIIGLGAMGSAACFHLARNQQRVLGIDQFTPPHSSGSSHGQTRIIREAYFEHPSYVPLVQRAYTLWDELESIAGHKLIQKTGGLMVGPPGSTVFEGSKRSAEEHRLPHQILSAADVRHQFPALNPDDSSLAVWEPRAGILFPELCIQAHLSAALHAGAVLSFDERVLRWKPESSGVRVITSRGEYYAEQLLISAGAWASQLLPHLQLPLQVERQILFWFNPITPSASALFQPDKCPIYLWEYEKNRFFYGFPDLGHGIKVARHHQGESAHPDHVRRSVSDLEIADMRQILDQCLPTANGPLQSSTVCLYTNTPDGHFLIDRDPQSPQVLIASPCSGHGFKFSSAIGEVLSNLLISGHSQFDLSLFQFRSFESRLS